MTEQAELQNQIITVLDHGDIIEVRLNRPQKRNALSLEMLEELKKLFRKISNSSTVRVLILSAEGPVFSSGHDLKEMPGREESDYHLLFSTCAEVMLAIRKLPQVVIAQVQGLATAAGCQLVAACDLAVCTETAKFATPGVKIGLFCTTPMVPLVRNIPAKIAMEMLMTGEPISAQRAYEIGLVNQVTPVDQLETATLTLAKKIAQSSPLVNAIGKRAFYQQLSLTEEEAYMQAVGVMTQNMLEQDAQEGVQAFLEKRAPIWKGA
jgi:enoyl-CoA hydratase/carnithine racemase